MFLESFMELVCDDDGMAHACLNPRVRIAEWLRQFPRYGNVSACQRRVGSSPTSDIFFGTFSLIQSMINCQPFLIDLISELISMITPLLDWQSNDVSTYHHVM